MTIKLTVAGNEVELTEAEARVLWAELDSVFARRETLPVFVPQLPFPHFYQPEPDPLPWWRHGPTCGTHVTTC